MKNKKLINESFKEVLNMIVRCRVKIDGREDPTLLDIMTDIRALPGIVVVRQNLPISEISSQGYRFVELKTSYSPNFIETEEDEKKLTKVLKSIKSVKGIDMIRVEEHDDINVMNQIKKSPITM